MRAASLFVFSVLVASSATAQMRERSGMSLDRADTNRDGVVTREEFVTARGEQFASRDRNNDGFIDKNDLSGRAAGRPRVEQAMEAIVKQFDANSDGKVAKGEFVEGGVKLFERADADKSGSLDKKEIETAKESLREAAGR